LFFIELPSVLANAITLFCGKNWIEKRWFPFPLHLYIYTSIIIIIIIIIITISLPFFF
jgi:hypothetical protein